MTVKGQQEVQARSRALRTFFQGLLVDVILVVAISLFNITSSDDFEWSGMYWSAYGLLLLRTVIHSVASYVMTHVKKPPTT